MCLRLQSSSLWLTKRALIQSLAPPLAGPSSDRASLPQEQALMFRLEALLAHHLEDCQAYIKQILFDGIAALLLLALSIYIWLTWL